MKKFLVFFALMMSFASFGQLIDGTLVEAGRKMTSQSDFKVIDQEEGVMYYELAVNPKGKVTSAKYLYEGSTVISTPTRVVVRNYLMKLTFEEGTHFPEFHHVRVKVAITKS